MGEAVIRLFKKGGYPMKRILSLLLVLALLLPVALAEEITLSPALQAKKLALDAIKEKYGFTNDTFGLFTLYVTTEKAGAHVRLIPNSYLPIDRIGEYEVAVSDGRAAASWTHDDQDPAYWQSDIMDSPCWGAKQLNVIRLSCGEGLDEYLPDNYAPAPMPPEYGGLTFALSAPQDSDMSQTEAMHLADAAIGQVYGLPAEEISFLDHDMEPDMLVTSKGQRLWNFIFADAERCFIVYIDAATGEAFDVALTTGGNG